MKTKSISEQLMYSTVLVETALGRGTGFFFHFKITDDIDVPVIFTNRHVVNYKENETVSMTFHLENENVIENIKITASVKWYSHSNKDLCYCYAMPIIQMAKNLSKKEVFYIPIDEKLVYDNAKLEDLSAIEDVIMVGYPIGLSDLDNNFPIFRRGITASHPSLNFNSQGIGVVDMACFPGSSGSPIFILNENSYSDKKGNTYLGTNRLIFLGILFQGPTFNAQGGVEIIDIPTQQMPIANVPIMVNLGYYIKANEIMEFKRIIEEQVKPEIEKAKQLQNNTETVNIE